MTPVTYRLLYLPTWDSVGLDCLEVQGLQINPKYFLRTGRQSTPGGSMFPKKCEPLGLTWETLTWCKEEESGEPDEKWAPS